jgi:uncharacterized OsmC-like protein
MANLKFTLKGANEGPARFVGQTRQFRLLVDEPEALGGTDQAANPVEYILAGYAGCLNVVGHLVAKELDFHLRKLDIELEGEINPDRLFGKPTSERAGYQFIKVNLVPDTDASDEQLIRWLDEVERRCPVNDNLARPTPIDLSLTRSQDIRKERSVA